MTADSIKITILDDGTIKTETDPISGPNHQSAEAFLKDITQLAGGTATRQAKAKHHHHRHTHGAHTHEYQ